MHGAINFDFTNILFETRVCEVVENLKKEIPKYSSLCLTFILDSEVFLKTLLCSYLCVT